MREAVVESHFKKRVEALGGLALKMTSPGRRGAPDRLAVMPDGILCWVEMKAPGKTPEPHQAREHQRLRDRGHIVLVLDTKELVDRYFGTDRGYLRLHLERLKA